MTKTQGEMTQNKPTEFEDGNSIVLEWVKTLDKKIHIPDKNKGVLSSMIAKAIREAEEKIKTKAMRACRDEYHNYTLDGQQIEEKISEL